MYFFESLLHVGIYEEANVIKIINKAKRFAEDRFLGFVGRIDMIHFYEIKIANGGADRTRTGNCCLSKAEFYQLNYSPDSTFLILKRIKKKTRKK